MGDPGDFGLEALEMVLLTLQVGLGNEEREVAVLDAQLLEVAVQEVPYGFPDGV